MSLRGAVSDEAIFGSRRDCFAPLAMTLYAMLWGFCLVVLKVCLKTGRPVSLRGAVSDEAIFGSNRDCFAEFILSTVEGLAITRYAEFADTL